MNIEKLVRHLKEFTLDEIEMIAECDCKTALEQLLNEDKLVFEQGLYKYKELEQKQTFEFIAKPKIYKNKKILFKDIALYYLNNRDLTYSTYKGYRYQLKYNILPYFGEKYIDKITYEMLIDFMTIMKSKYKAKTASNGVTLVGSIMKYAFFEGYIKYNPYFGVINSKCK